MDASVYVRALLLPQSYQYPNLSECADRIGGQLRGDKECPFSGVTKSGRIWRKVPESDARNVVGCVWYVRCWVVQHVGYMKHRTVLGLVCVVCNLLGGAACTICDA